MPGASLEPETAAAFGHWLTTYKRTHRDLLAGDPEFARWLEEEYVPIAGGWEY